MCISLFSSRGLLTVLVHVRLFLFQVLSNAGNCNKNHKNKHSIINTNSSSRNSNITNTKKSQREGMRLRMVGDCQLVLLVLAQVTLWRKWPSALRRCDMPSLHVQGVCACTCTSSLYSTSVLVQPVHVLILILILCVDRILQSCITCFHASDSYNIILYAVAMQSPFIGEQYRSSMSRQDKYIMYVRTCTLL